MTENYDFKNHKDDALTKPRDLCWDNWFKFEKVGDSVQGFIRDVFFRASEGDFPEQRGITLEQPGKLGLINVGIKHIDFVLKKTDPLRLGDPLTIVFEKELKSATKGHSPTKVMGFYGKEMPENAGEKTVAQLEAEDRGDMEAAKPADVAEFDAAKTDQETPSEEGTPLGETPTPSEEATKKEE